MARALALISGGLDSGLAAKLVKDQGVEVIGICFKSAFFGCDRAVKMCEQIDIPLKVVDFSEEHLEMVKNPKHGYGKNMNPCIDCHAMMLNYAGKLMKELEADFIITGEVLNQRPMSQNRQALDIVKKESGYEEYILRPLCAKNLPETWMEKQGLVDREKLLDISGRGRKVQMELAEKWNIKEYPSPAGGCKLTDPGFSKRLKDLLTHNKEAKAQDIDILNIGRHFRINENVKIISTRTQDEFKMLKTMIKEGDYIFDTLDVTGSTVVLRGKPSEEDIILAARIAARYSKAREEKNVRVKYRIYNENKYNILTVEPALDDEISKYMV
ncbi:MAG: tRNA 4-thiouridine(8) synthase ThiI [Caloramator sp.]|nr:MAG: tRNA 4-thiouridine(8) synthase ThiI [Caloramator sp.]